VETAGYPPINSRCVEGIGGGGSMGRNVGWGPLPTSEQGEGFSLLILA
jgi:hypothetical protein